MYEARTFPVSSRRYRITRTGQRFRIGLFCFRIAGGSEIRSWVRALVVTGPQPSWRPSVETVFLQARLHGLDPTKVLLPLNASWFLLEIEFGSG